MDLGAIVGVDNCFPHLFIQEQSHRCPLLIENL